jgi:PAS domain S-box-containing protein
LPISEIHPHFDRNKNKTGFTLIAPDFNENAIVRSKKNYDDLVTSTEQFNFLFSYAPIGMALVRTDGVLIRVSQSFCQLIGYSEEELLQTDFQSITHPDDLQKKLIRGEISTYQLEKRYLHKKGHEVWGLLIVTLPLQKGNDSNYVISQVYDISNQKHALEALTESEERFRLLTENSFDSMTMLNEHGECLYLSPYVFKMTGFLPEEMLFKKYTEFVHPDDVAQVKIFHESIMKEPEKTHKHRHRFLCKNGEIAWIEGYATNALNLKGLNAIIANFQDITELVTTTQQIEENRSIFEAERKKTIDELRLSEANLKSIFNNTEIGYILLDNDGFILSFNKRLHDLCSPKDVSKLRTGLPLTSLLSEKRSKVVKKHLRHAIKYGVPISYEIDYAETSRSTHSFVQIDIIPVKEGENVMGICIACQDITDRKQAELEREKLTTDIVGRNRDLEQFTYILSHNLRAPVASILGLTRVLQETELTQEDNKFFSEQLFTSAEQLDEVIRDLNQVLNLRRDVSDLRETVDLHSLIQKVKNDMPYFHVENNTQIEISLEISEIYAVKSYLYSIFYNLISNSIKFRKLEIPSTIRITTRRQASKIVLSFEDNGIGIDMKRKSEHIFGLYKRFHSHISGKGMGLYMTKAHVEILGGKIAVHSEVNKGTTFLIELS